MAHKIEIISRNYNGELSYCTCCKTYHLHFNNLYFEFSEEELNNFKQIICFSEDLVADMPANKRMMKRHIPIETGQVNMVLMFNFKEIKALRGLLFFQEKTSTGGLAPLDINYDFSLN